MRDFNKEFKSLRCVNKTWFYRFFKMLEECNVDEALIDKAISLALDQDNRYGVVVNSDNVFYNNSKTTKGIDNFFAYMEDVALNKGIEGFKQLLEDIIVRVENNFLELKKENKEIKTNFFYLVMRELLIANPRDAQTNWSMQSGEKYGGRLDFMLGGISLAYLLFAEEPANIDLIVYDDFRTLPGLERLGIGSHVFHEFCKRIIKEKPNYSVMACGVEKGKDGEKAYSSWGGYPVRPKSKDRCWMIEDRPLTEEEYKNAPSFIHFYFPCEVIMDNAKKSSKKYGLQDFKQGFMGE